MDLGWESRKLAIVPDVFVFMIGLITVVAGPCGAGDVSGGTAGEKVSGSVECCSPVAAAAAGSTRTWA